MARGTLPSSEHVQKFRGRPSSTATTITSDQLCGSNLSQICLTLHLIPSIRDIVRISQWCVPPRLHRSVHLTSAGPPHNNTSRLFRRPYNRPRRLRILPSSRSRSEICCCQPKRQWWRWKRFLRLQHHHGRSMSDPERRTRKNGQHRDRSCHRTLQATV